MATIGLRYYGRWDERCVWQLERTKERTITEEALHDFLKDPESAGFVYSERYDEFYVISADKLKMTVVSVLE